MAVCSLYARHVVGQGKIEPKNVRQSVERCLYRQHGCYIVLHVHTNDVCFADLASQESTTFEDFQKRIKTAFILNYVGIALSVLLSIAIISLFLSGYFDNEPVASPPKT